MPKTKTATENTNNYWYELTVLPSQHISREEERGLVAKIAKKHGVSPGKVRLTIKRVNPDGTTSTDMALNAENIQNIQDPKYQVKLFRDYLNENGIKDYDWDEILDIDSRVNALIDYNMYEKGRRFELKYAKWKNFLSYGPDNYFDFTTLHGLVHLKGEPANKSGKSTFAYDLIHFGLFGKTRSGKADTKAEMFNNYLPDERELFVELGIAINGENYVIRRTLTRPDPKKKSRNITNTVEYFRVNSNGENEKLEDNENLQGESTTKTSQIIKEAVGSEEDFDRIISANAKDLDELISMKDTDRGRVLSRWIGLLPIEDKEAKAKELWSIASTGRFCDIYDRETLNAEIRELVEENKNLEETIKNCQQKIEDAKAQKDSDQKKRDDLLSAKHRIDENVLGINVVTKEKQLSDLVVKGKETAAQIKTLREEIEAIGDIEFPDNDYAALLKKREELSSEMSALRTEVSTAKQMIQTLKKGEYCPTCGRKMENIDNSSAIRENEEKVKLGTDKGIKLKGEYDKVSQTISEMEAQRKLLTEKNQKELKFQALNVELTKLRSEYKEVGQLLEAYRQNRDAIIENNEIDVKVNVLQTNITTYDNMIHQFEGERVGAQKDVETNKAAIREKESTIKQIEREIETEKNWRLYLKMIGKDGICKMVLRSTLPLINGELDNLLCDVADFKVEVEVNEKNDIEFWLVRDEIKTRLSAGSGLERTMASLALRVVLGKMSNLSRPPFIVLDEILGSVAAENYDDMKRLYDKIALEYDYVLHICHIDLDWYDGNVVTVIKKDNISMIERD